jgi:hypothetical protein
MLFGALFMYNEKTFEASKLFRMRFSTRVVAETGVSNEH